MITTSSAFSLFTAYQFLSSNELVSDPKSKTRPYPSRVYQRLCAYMIEMIATSFFFAYCVSKFERWFLFSKGLDNPWILSYNTTPAEGERSTSLLSAAWFYLTTCLSALYLRLTTYGSWSVPTCSICFCSPFSCISSLLAKQFSNVFTTWKQDHMTIILYSDLTTSLTINSSGVRGDKMARKYEKAVFA